MSKDYNVDDILSEIKSKKSKAPKEQAAPKVSRPKPEKIQPRSDFKIDQKEQFAQTRPPLKDTRTEQEDLPFPPPRKPEPVSPQIPKGNPPKQGSTPFFSGYDAPDESLFRPSKKAQPKQQEPAQEEELFFSGMTSSDFEGPDEPLYQPPGKTAGKAPQFTGPAKGAKPAKSSNTGNTANPSGKAKPSNVEDLLFTSPVTDFGAPDEPLYRPSSRSEEPPVRPKKAPPRQELLPEEDLRFGDPDDLLFSSGISSADPVPPDFGGEPSGSGYSQYMDSFPADDDLLSNFRTGKKQQAPPPPMPEPSIQEPSMQEPQESLFDGDLFGDGSFSFDEPELDGGFSEEDAFRTTRFDAPPRDPAPAGEPFRVTLPDDGSAESPSPAQDNGPPDPGRKKILFPRSRQNQPDGNDTMASRYSRLANGDVPVPEDSGEESGEVEDYNSPKDKEPILKDMKSIKMGLLLRFGLLLVVFGVSLYLSLAVRNVQVGEYLLPLPEFIWPEKHLRVYMIVSTLIAALAALICSNTVGGGLLALFQFHANTDSLPALAVVGTLAQGVTYIIRPALFGADKADFDTNLYLFFPVAIFILIFNVIGKLMVILRIQNNFKLVASDRAKNSVVFMKDKRLLRELTKGLSMEEYTIAYPEKTRFLAHFLDNSYSEDHAENMSRVLAPLCLLAAVLLAVLSYLFNKDIAVSITTFTAVMCICAPLTSTIAANLPLLRLSSALTPVGGMVAGYSSVETFSRTEAVVMNACDVFLPENVVLHGIKAFDQGKIDSVILDAASVVCTTNGMLTAVFSKIIGSDKGMLKTVENIAYEDSMGLSAWVDGKRVLIGNRDLMMNHGIEVPSNDYEMRFVKDSKNIIYLSNSGELSAMFVISYNPNTAVQQELDKLASRGMYLIVETSDPNITAEKIRDAYDFPIEQIRLLPAKLHKEYLELSAEKAKSPAKIGFIGSSTTMVKAICACMKIKSSVEQAVMIQMVALVVGYGLVALFSLMGNLSMLSILHLLLFHGLWALIGILVPNLKKL